MNRVPLGIAAYVLAILIPVAVALLPPRPDGRGLAVELGVAVGFIAFAMLAAQFLLTARFPRLASPLGLDRLIRFHRVAGVLALLAVLTHVGILIVIDAEFRAFLNPFDDLPRAGALWMVLGALVGLVVLTIWRRQLRIPYQWWRLTHGLLALLVMLIAIVHVFQVGYYSSAVWKMAVWALIGVAAMSLLVWTRVIRSIRNLRHPWTVVDVRQEKGRAWTVALEPVGHAGMSFRAGQFAWLTLDQPPWHIDAHPYSFSSSAVLADDTGRVEFTIKELGDFTARTGDVPVGARAYLDGPYGNFVLDDTAAGAVFVVGGVGVTPALSILRTLRDLGDDRPTWLVYGTGSPDKIIADDELADLRDQGSLQLTVVVEEAGDEWQGERGLITEDLLRRVLPPLDERDLAVFCCGPDEMMDAVIPSLEALGASGDRLRAERFNLA